MNDQTDQQLLRDYGMHRSEAAFAELVRRHVDLVHSAAHRMLGDPHLARDITQATFVALAQHAAQLTDRPALSGWLHTTARNLAVKTIRTDARRRVREQEAVVMNELLSADSEASWEEIAPHLDAALGALAEPERDAVLLRYFEKKSAAEIGSTLGISAAAAQKRVSRAVEGLRECFAKRGVTVGAGGLVVVISANAVQAAPVGLVVTISAAALAGTAATTSTFIAATTKTIAMTTLQKSLVTATVAVLAGAGIYQARQAVQLREQVQTLQQQQAPLAEQIQQLQGERDDATNRLADLLAENSQLKATPERNEILRLRGQVAVASRAAAEATAKTHDVRNDSEPSRDDQRNQARAHLETFFKLTNLSREKADQYVDLEVEMKRRQDERMAALLGGTLSVADAVRQRDQATQEQQNRRRELLGPNGWATLESIADGMRESVAKRLTSAAQASLRNEPLTQEQTDRLQSTIKAGVAANSTDDTDLFRPEAEWTQMVSDQQQHVLQAASEFLTPAQQQTLQILVGENLKQMLQQRDQRRKALGINP